MIDDSTTGNYTDDLARQVKTAQARALLANSPMTLVANCVIAATEASILWHYSRNPIVLWWFFGLLVLNMVRLYVARRLTRMVMTTQAPNKTLAVISAGSVLAGLMWALPPTFGFDTTTDGSNAYTVFMICGISAGAAIQSSMYARNAIAFVVPPMLSTIVYLLHEMTFVTAVIALDVALLMAMIVRSSVLGETRFVESQRDQLEAVHLAASLATANTEISHSNRQLETLANCDPLTGLGNRAAFNRRLRYLVEDQRQDSFPVALLIIDLDRFKSINDTMGHGAGDRVLTEVARRLLSLMGTSDHVSRLGGDEFAILLEGPDAMERAETIGAAVMALTATPITIGDRPVTVGSSVGLALYPEHGLTAEDLFASADIALYSAKDQGRRCVCIFNPQIRQRLERQKQIEIGLEAAIETGEVYAVFQPQINMLSNDIVGFEALVRWTHPTLGPVSPPEIVQAAHSIYAAEALTRHIARAAAALVVDLSRLEFASTCVAINVSPRELSAYSVSAMLQDVVREFSISTASIEIEITEEAILDIETAGEQLANLGRAGFRLAVDDFGMGHSSLAHLMKLRVDRIKVDRSFVDGIAGSSQNRALISALVGIGHALAVEVVVEGVETPDDAEVLRMLGCRLAQGYLFGRPMEATHLINWIGHRNEGLAVSA